MLGLQCCFGFLSSCSKQVLLSSCSARASHCCGFFYSGAQALGHRLSSCGTRASFSAACGIFSGSGIKPVSPALIDGFFTTEPPHCSFYLHFFNNERYWAPLHVFIVTICIISHLYAFFGEISIYIFLFYDCVVCFSGIELHELLVCFGDQSFVSC